MNWQMSRTVVWLAALLIAALSPRAASVAVQPPQATAATARWADWVERDFPSSSVVDARAAGLGHAENLSPRALVLNLGYGCWAAFDTDLLRVAAIWNGPGSLPHWLPVVLRPDKKTPAGRRRRQSRSAAGSPTASIPDGSSRAAVLLRSTRTGANRRGSGAWPDSGEPGPVRGSPAAVGRRQPRLPGRPDGGHRVDNRARRDNRRRTASDGHTPFQDCRVRTRRWSSCWAAGAPIPNSPCRRIPRRPDGITLAEYSADGSEVADGRFTQPSGELVHRPARRSQRKAEATNCLTRSAVRRSWPAHRRPVEFSVLVSSRSSKSIDAGGAPPLQRPCANAPAGAGTARSSRALRRHRPGRRSS